MNEYPDRTTLNRNNDTSLYGFYASLAAGGFLLAYAIYYVTIVNVSSDYAYLTLGVMTGIIALSCAIFHEWMRRSNGPSREENAIEEYSSATAVLMGSLSVIWLSRFLVYYLGKVIDIVEIQDGEIWIPVWLSLLQTISLIIVMEVSIKLINRHSLGTLPRTIVILAPISLAFSAITIWLDYTRNELDIFLTISFILLMGSSIVASLRLKRSILYLLSSGLAVLLPLLLGMSNPEHLGLLVPFVIIIGITATDRSLSRQMIERGSGVVVCAILLAQMISAGNETNYIFAEFFESPSPFGLTFWLWVSLLVGWFAPTYMLRTPAMPIALAFSLTLLSSEAALIGWLVAIIAFIYLETREQARDWVVKSTFATMIFAWWVSSIIGVVTDSDLISIGEFTLDYTTGSTFLLFPILLGLSYWGYSRGRFQKYWFSALILSASLNFLLIAESNIIFPVTLMVISALQFYDFTVNDRGGKNLVDRNLYTIFLLLPTFLLTIQIPETIMINDIDVLPILVLIAFYSLSYSYRESKENLVMTPEFFFAMLLLPIFIIVNVNDYNENIQKTISLILLVVILSVILLINESGGVRRTTPLERLFGIIYLLPVAVISSDILLEVDASITYLILHDILILSAPLVVNFRLKKLHDISEEARTIGTVTLLILLFIGLTDISGGFLALPVFSLAVFRATKHVSTPILLTLPVMAIIYATIFGNNNSDNSILWSMLEGLPYLGDFSELLIFETPRWVSLLLLSIPLMVFYNIPEENKRPEGSRYGPEQLFGPIIATLLGLSFLLPDEKLAPLFIVTILTYGSWRYGLIHWFWINPFATYWAIINLAQLIGITDNYFTGVVSFIAGLISIAQFYLLKNKLLYANISESFLNKNFHLEIWSRVVGYSFLLISGDFSDLVPFITSILIMYDTYKYSLFRAFYASILLQLYTFSTLFEFISFGYISLWPITIGLFLIHCSWKKYNFFNNWNEEKISDFNHEYEFGLLGSILVLFFTIPFENEINSEYLIEMTIVVLSIHHMILGFKRDQGWRRLFGLIGLPLGLVSLGFQFGDLILVLFLFLAALTLIGQAVLYSSKGGLGIGSTIEGAEPILSRIGLPNEIQNNESIETIQPADPGDVIQNNESNETIQPADSIDEISNVKISEKEVITDIKMPSGIISHPVFDAKESSFKVVLEQELIDNLNKIMMESKKSYEPTNWIPFLRVHPDGNLYLEWGEK